jgi:hypothetical protein
MPKLQWFKYRVERIRDLSESLVKGEVVDVPEVAATTDPTTGEIITAAIPATYIQSPTTQASLVEVAKLYLYNNYALDDILYDATDLNELIVAVTYVIETLIAQSNLANDATFTWWKSKVIGE